RDRNVTGVQTCALPIFTLVYGGASVGIMGAVADTVLKEGGQVIGVMPSFLEQREISHKKLSELIVVDTMHERKAKMADLAEGFEIGRASCREREETQGV